MLSKCANPACGTPFQYLREGRLFKFEVSSSLPAGPHIIAGASKPARKIEHFWLCGRCAATMTLTLKQQREVVVMQRWQSRQAAAS